MVIKGGFSKICFTAVLNVIFHLLQEYGENWKLVYCYVFTHMSEKVDKIHEVSRLEGSFLELSQPFGKQVAASKILLRTILEVIMLIFLRETKELMMLIIKQFSLFYTCLKRL